MLMFSIFLTLPMNCILNNSHLGTVYRALLKKSLKLNGKPNTEQTRNKNGNITRTITKKNSDCR